MKDAPNGKRIRQQSCCLPQTPVVVDGIEVPRVKEGVPVGHVNEGFLHLWPCILELREKTTRPEVVVVLVDLAQGIANLQVSLIVVGPVFLAAVHRDAAVGALKVDVSWRHWSTMLVVRMWASGMLSNEGSAAPNLGNWGISE
jgi:hypothetical protein